MEKKISKEKKNQKTRKNMNLIINNKGITLIALVITIIVLLILAGVTINLTLGENGIFRTAEQAGRNYTQAQEQELAGLANFENTINNIIGGINTPTVVEEENFADAVTATNYGDYVDYPIDLNGDGNTTNDWRIFYNNGERIFIIAADYVESDSSFLDLSEAQMYRVADDPRYSSFRYSLNWHDSVNNTTTLTSFQGNADINEVMSSMFMYGKYLTQNSTSANTNAKATAAMLSQTAWAGFKDSDYAQYAVGGPTLEMWVASYNAKGYTPLYTNVNDTGYYVGNEEETTGYDYDLSSDADTGYNDTLYFLHPTGGGSACAGYWLASPGADSSGNVMHVEYIGYVGGISYFDSYTGIRPVVSLKPTVTAIQNESNGVWELSI
mgnify:CR=1 FL=1